MAATSLPLCSSPRGASGSVPHPKHRGCCASERSWTLALPGRSQIKAIRLCRSLCPAPAPGTGLAPSCESEACEAMKPTLLLHHAVVHRTNPPWELCQCTVLGTALLFSLLPSATVVTEKPASGRARGCLTGVLASRVLSITSATTEAKKLIQWTDLQMGLSGSHPSCDHISITGLFPWFSIISLEPLPFCIPGKGCPVKTAQG